MMARLAKALLPYFVSEARERASQVSYAPIARRRWTHDWVNGVLTRAELLLLCLGVVMVSGGWLANHYLDSAIATAPADATAQTPTYIAPFTAYPNSDWYYHQPTKSDSSSYAFVADAYQMTSSNPKSSVTSWIRTTFRDGAEQVTVVERGKANENNLAWVGLMLDTNSDGTRFTTFMIDEFGDWSLSHYDGTLPADQQWSTPDAGYSDAIHQGEGAANTLLLIRQGNLYLLYVNNRLVDRYYDRDHSLSPGGEVGVYLDEGGYVARFTDFALYPVPPQLPSWAR